MEKNISHLQSNESQSNVKDNFPHSICESSNEKKMARKINLPEHVKTIDVLVWAFNERATVVGKVGMVTEKRFDFLLVTPPLKKLKNVYVIN